MAASPASSASSATSSGVPCPTTPTHGFFQSNSFIYCAAKLNSTVPVSRKLKITATTALPAGAKPSASAQKKPPAPQPSVNDTKVYIQPTYLTSARLSRE